VRTHILPVIGLTFAMLFLSRTAAVSAEVTPSDKKTEDIAETQEAEPQAAIEETEQCLTGTVLETLTADMTRLETRQKEIAEREVALAAIEKKLETQMTAIEKTNQSLQLKIDSLKTLASDDLLHLVGMYQTMKPKQAAEIFDSMDPAFAAGFLREMNSDKAGLIMANMDARKSYAISVIIAGRNAKYRPSKS